MTGHSESDTEPVLLLDRQGAVVPLTLIWPCRDDCPRQAEQPVAEVPPDYRRARCAEVPPDLSLDPAPHLNLALRQASTQSRYFGKY